MDTVCVVIVSCGSGGDGGVTGRGGCWWSLGVLSVNHVCHKRKSQSTDGWTTDHNPRAVLDSRVVDLSVALCSVCVCVCVWVCVCGCVGVCYVFGRSPETTDPLIG